MPDYVLYRIHIAEWIILKRNHGLYEYFCTCNSEDAAALIMDKIDG